MARGTWHEEDERLALSYDPNLMLPLQELVLDRPMPDLWKLFDGLTPVPVLVLRGENSDLLSEQTLRAMRERHPRLTGITVPGQGHAPLLEGPVLQSIRDLVARAEASP